MQVKTELKCSLLPSQFVKFGGKTWYKLQTNSKVVCMWHCIMTESNFTLRNAWICGILDDYPSILFFVVAKSNIAKVPLCCPMGHFQQDTRSACGDLGLDYVFRHFGLS
jgi:hypothetical protein